MSLKKAQAKVGLTIMLSEEFLGWLRLEADKRQVSVAGYVRGVLSEKIGYVPSEAKDRERKMSHERDEADINRRLGI